MWAVVFPVTTVQYLSSGVTKGVEQRGGTFAGEAGEEVQNILTKISHD